MLFKYRLDYLGRTSEVVMKIGELRLSDFPLYRIYYGNDFLFDSYILDEDFLNERIACCYVDPHLFHPEHVHVYTQLGEEVR